MAIVNHIRRPNPMPVRGRWVMRCDCGWVGRVAQFDGTRARSRDEVDRDLEQLFVEHVPATDRRTYLLLDTRPPVGAESLVNDDGAPIIVGCFVMPEGLPIRLLDTREDGGVHYGRFAVGAEEPAELPIGEVRTPEGRVFRLDE